MALVVTVLGGAVLAWVAIKGELGIGWFLGALAIVVAALALCLILMTRARDNHLETFGMRLQGTGLLSLDSANPYLLVQLIGVALAAVVGLGPATVRAGPAAAVAGIEVTATIGVGRSPRGLALDPRSRRLYVANSASSTISVISERTSKVVATVKVGRQPVGIAVNPCTGRVIYTANFVTSPSVLAVNALGQYGTRADASGIDGLSLQGRRRAG